jgi:hypothetical protein
MPWVDVPQNPIRKTLLRKPPTPSWIIETDKNLAKNADILGSIHIRA